MSQLLNLRAVDVAYGIIGQTEWRFMTVNSNVACNNTTFGDPLVNIVKACYTRPTTATGGLTMGT